MNTQLSLNPKNNSAKPLPWMTSQTDLLQRKSPYGSSQSLDNQGAEHQKKPLGLQRALLSSSGDKPAVVPPIVHEVLRSPGQPLDPAARAYLEPHFGHDFSRVRVHTGSRAEKSAQAINALAYTVGQNIVFSSRQYSPGSTAGRHLLAHELTHVVQQNHTAFLGQSLSLGRTGTQPEREANVIAEGFTSRPVPSQVHPLAFTPVGISIQRQQAAQLQTQGQPAPVIHVGIIPIREFIRHVETIENSFPNSRPQEILTMIRSLYYGSPAGSPGFDRLIPDAPNTGAVQTCTDSEGSRCEAPIGTCLCVYAHGLAMDTPELQQAIARLRQHADENEIADNPSPYIQVGSDLIDVGHLLVGIDAILHPRTSFPFSTHGLTTAPGPATWDGDVGAGMVYLQEHQQNRVKSPDVRGNPSPTLEDYYRNSLPREDLLGDVDSFGMAQFVGPQTLSAALRAYYVSESGGTPRVRFNRWRNFASVNGLTYTESGGRIVFTQQARQTVIERITNFANLFAGRTSPVRAVTLGIPRQSWPAAGAFADRFLQDVKQGLEEEISRNP